MCDVLTLTGIALTAGSTLANSIAASKVDRARNNVMAAERIRQNKLDQEAANINTQSQDRYKDFGGQQAQTASDLGQYFADQRIEDATANQAATNQLNVPASSSNVTVQEEQKQRDKADAFGQQQGEALGNLRSFGDLLGTIGRSQARDASLIGQIGGFKQGSSNVVPYELDSAGHAGDGLKLFGDVLGLGGTIALGKGLSAGGGAGSGITNYASHTTFPSAPALPAGAMAARYPSNLYSLYGGGGGLY
ncbi:MULTISPECIES: hypothetical protein [unclassified Mesorhizobium]|uniref:hypothetical protein n=1 Tax=unclassified Mesorhizobium TaxID=325217 RepID=UPI000FDC42FC|nr:MULTISPECIES: hypothetical protein [unclassified Mesorhizobium]TGT76140.1 hypothetical protein EN809_000505 [Mesorhizobium sp. M2E.F.Ca.ET.166.01.1.1]TGW02255.1 hypothetical protein EN797_000505 [Mesorhizobium sp. M2E.F.Ca.ET.154.01.1.1]